MRRISSVRQCYCVVDRTVVASPVGTVGLFLCVAVELVWQMVQGALGHGHEVK